MGSLAAPGISAGSNPPCWNRQGSGNGRRRSIDHSSDPTVGGDRSRSERRLRRYHLQKRPVILANAGEFSRRRCVSGRNWRLHGVEYDELSGKLLLGALKDLDVEDRVNLLSDSWALVQANRAPIALYFELVENLPASTELAEREQIIHVLDFINRLVSGSSEQEEFQRYARSLLRPTFDAVGWEARPDEQPARTNLRASLIVALGHLNDPKIVASCRERFKGYLANPNSLAPDLRPAVFSVVGRYADESTWNELHQLGLKTMSIEEKQNYYDALAGAIEPKLVKKSLPIALTDELPTSRAVFLVSRVARESGHPGIAWDFARANMKALLAKTDALGANTYAPSLFIFFSDDSRAEELRSYAKNSLPAASAPGVAKAVDEIHFQSEFKKRLARQLIAWIGEKINRR